MEPWDRFDIFKKMCKAADEGNKEKVFEEIEKIIDVMIEPVKYERAEEEWREMLDSKVLAEEQDCDAYALEHAFPRRELIKVLKNSVKK